MYVRVCACTSAYVDHFVVLPVQQHAVDGLLEVEWMSTELLVVLQAEWFQQHSLSHRECQPQYCIGWRQLTLI